MAVANPTDAKITELEHDWPAWQIWAVPTWDGNQRATIWCAKRWDWQPGQPVLNEDSAEHLAEALAEQAEQ